MRRTRSRARRNCDLHLSTVNLDAAASVQSLVDDLDDDSISSSSLPSTEDDPRYDISYDNNSDNQGDISRFDFPAPELHVQWGQQHNQFNQFNNSNSSSDSIAAAVGRELLGRNHNNNNATSRDPFTASAADTPLPRARTNDKPLKSCLSSSNLGRRCKSEPVARGQANTINDDDDDGIVGGNGKPRKSVQRNVSFSILQVREYEVTLGDNPSVSSGAPLSLGWRYDPQEKVSSLIDNDNDDNDDDGNPAAAASNDNASPSSSQSSCRGRIRRTVSELKLTDIERQFRLHVNPRVSVEDVRAVLLSTARARLERTESLNEWRMERMARRAVDMTYDLRPTMMRQTLDMTNF